MKFFQAGMIVKIICFSPILAWVSFNFPGKPADLSLRHFCLYSIWLGTGLFIYEIEFLHGIGSLVAGRCQVFDPVGSSGFSRWKMDSDSSLITARTFHTATLLPNGEVLIVGGHEYSDDVSMVEIYKPNEGVFVQAADLSPGRVSHTATLLKNGQVLVVGGQSNGRTLDSADLYNPVTGIWIHTGSLHFARSYHAATLLPNGQVLVSGGIRVASPPVYSQGAPPGSATESAELYDPATGWTLTGSLHSARYTHNSILLSNGLVLVMGGQSSQGFFDCMASAELYNPNTRTWSETGNMSNKRCWPAASLLRNGQVLVAGGQDRETRFTSTELYNPQTGTWSPTGNLLCPISESILPLLPNGHAFLAGGTDPSGVTGRAESYDPTSGAWEQLAAMNIPSYGHSMTLLSNGKVLIAGGSNGNSLPSGVISRAELFDAKAEIFQPFTSGTVALELSAVQSNISSQSLINFAASMVIITTCVVIFTACVVVLLGVWLVIVLVRKWIK